jgi:hypothetical protein
VTANSATLLLVLGELLQGKKLTLFNGATQYHEKKNV